MRQGPAIKGRSFETWVIHLCDRCRLGNFLFPLLTYIEVVSRCLTNDMHVSKSSLPS
jgi:hypothetical protein